MSYAGHMLMFPNLCLLAESLLHIAAYSGQEPACSLISHVCEMFSCIAFTLFYMQYVSLVTLYSKDQFVNVIYIKPYCRYVVRFKLNRGPSMCRTVCFFSANRSTLSTHYQTKNEDSRG